MLVERCIEMQKDLHLCFIDYSKAFDKVRHVELFRMLEKLDIDGKDLRVIRNLYWDQTASVRMEGEHSDFKPIKRGDGNQYGPCLCSGFTQCGLAQSSQQTYPPQSYPPQSYPPQPYPPQIYPPQSYPPGYPYPPAQPETLPSRSNGNAFIDPNDAYLNLFNNLGPCQMPACSYNPVTMTGSVDMNDCRLVSYGASDAATLSFDGLHAASVRLDTQGCQGSAQSAPGALTLCFRSTRGENLLCSGDGGAPVYCRAPRNNEWILMGVTIYDQQTCESSPEASVIPFPYTV
ncbi:LINE-1 reverse transcriptase [Plakobranchus ocellatus]|uniref:LINE-1 reverse transcriptase n=1 Tax=Plakobranchus ocellatus TaxID=259542 RepID=A0AAV4AEG8_9GAST|nr:LINE-1 reverse transcriptase [Plakobranchus ocellatus]